MKVSACGLVCVCENDNRKKERERESVIFGGIYWPLLIIKHIYTRLKGTLA